MLSTELSWLPSMRRPTRISRLPGTEPPIKIRNKLAVGLWLLMLNASLSERGYRTYILDANLNIFEPLNHCYKILSMGPLKFRGHLCAVCEKRRFSSHLFAMPSFLAGFGRILDLGGAFDYYNYSNSPQEADANAMFGDWYTTGIDLKEAEHEFESRQPKEAEISKGSSRSDCSPGRSPAGRSAAR